MFRWSLQKNGITLESCKQVPFLLFVVEGYGLTARYFYFTIEVVDK